METSHCAIRQFLRRRQKGRKRLSKLIKYASCGVIFAALDVEVRKRALRKKKTPLTLESLSIKEQLIFFSIFFG